MHVFVRQLDVLYHSKLPKFIISDGRVECLKWLALIAMTLDHVNKIIFKSQMPLMSEIGRIAMPLFSMVLAYNLARPSALQKNIHIRSIAKMLIFGVLALPFYMLAFESTKIISLNIMFTLMLLTSMIYLIEKGGLYRELQHECITPVTLGTMCIGNQCH